MTPDKHNSPRGVLALGVVLLGAGLLLARRHLPEWRPVPPVGRELVAKATRALADSGGTLRNARAHLTSPVQYAPGYERAFRVLGSGGTAYLEATGGALARSVTGSYEVAGVGVGPVEVDFDAAGEIRAFEWVPGNAIFSFAELSEPARRARAELMSKLERQVLGARRPTGRVFSYIGNNVPVTVKHLEAVPGEPGEALVRVEPPNGSLVVQRTLADSEAARRRGANRVMRSVLLAGAPQAILVLLVAVLFALLLFRRRLSPRLGTRLVILAFLSMLVGGLGPDGDAGGPEVYAITVGFRLLLLLYLGILWMVGESMLRETVPGFTTSLDALAAGRLGPRAGRALLAGFGVGAAAAGVHLLASAGAAALAASGFRPERGTFELPLFSGATTPFYEGPFLTAVFVLFCALLRFSVARRFAEPAAAVLFALFLSLRVPLEPWGGAFAAALLVSILFLHVFQRFGFASLLVAVTTAPLLRDTLAALHLWRENAVPFLLGAVALAVIPVAGVIGLKRPPREDEGKVDAPEYVKRLESERRVKYEMDLLSRMQLALLPEKPPDVAGLDIAVTTVLATEAGGDLYDFAVDASGALWIAAGDVSGHGYSCGIQQAMVKASLSSLIGAGRSPGEILVEIDRVLRTGRTRLFTSLVLIRLDPASGTGVFANAGHPFPLLLEGGACAELSAPGLPLAQGPARSYPDRPLALAPGAVLVVASDGLYEGPDRFDEPYGYERPRVVLSSVGLHRRPASAIVEALFADWRRHVGEEAPSDDTTVLVVKRPAAFALPS